jgi:glutathione S-transferase
MYVLHIGNKNYSSWSLRPWILMKVLGIPFQEELHRFVGDPFARSFPKLSPSGKVPYLIDGDLGIWESIAIAEYLAERHDGIWPKDNAARAWARAAAAEMHGGFSEIRNVCSMNVGLRVKLHAVSPGLRDNLTRLEALWHDGFTRFGGPWLTGDTFGAVDAFYAPFAFRFQTYDAPLGAEARAYLDRLLALPAMQEWQKAALAEDFRDPPHDADCAASGTITDDFRAPVPA